jgi:3-deoxy-D-manno-octulosonate 8-phosphate phosphatase KdsC-like HAD superfamily phosphatase
MPGFVRAVALDLDGTLTDDGRLSPVALSAIERARDGGVVVILVTGRILSELEADFPGIGQCFDAVVGENGAVISLGDDVRELAPPVEDAVSEALAARGVSVRGGRVLLACDAAHAPDVVDTCGALGLDCQVVRNRGALMVLPAGVSKGMGLLAALAEFGVSAHNTLAVGDAENDLALLEAAEVGVAVANALPSLQAHADLVLEQPDGAGVAALLSGPIRSGQQLVWPARRRLMIGRFEDGTPATVPGAQANVLVCGDSGAGKSYLAGLLVEGWVTHGYTVLVLDMEGDHVALDRLHNTVVLDGQPSAAELLSVLRQQSLSVVLDVSTLSPDGRLEYLRTLPPVIEAERAAWGLPHWIVVDEAHATLGEGGVAANVFRPTDRGYCLVTYHPEQLCAEALATIDVTITATALEPARRGGAQARLRESGGLERSVTLWPGARPTCVIAASTQPRRCRASGGLTFAGRTVRSSRPRATLVRSRGCCAAPIPRSSCTISSVVTSRAGSRGRCRTASSARPRARSSATSSRAGRPTWCTPASVCSTRSAPATSARPKACSQARGAGPCGCRRRRRTRRRRAAVRR